MPLQLFKKQQRAPPIERVKELSSHGFSEPEIIDVLRKEGYSPQEIDLALTHALKERLQAPSVEPKEKEEAKLPTFEDVAKKVQPEQPPQETNIQYIQTQTQQYSWEDYFSYIDYLIHSRVSEITKEIEKINLKNQNLEKRIEEISQNIRQTVFAESEKYSQILKRIEEINASINELSKKIEALEEILKEILPALIESVRSLSKLIQQK
jgi:DNA-binding transcriptional MerR regulator